MMTTTTTMRGAPARTLRAHGILRGIADAYSIESVKAVRPWPLRAGALGLVLLCVTSGAWRYLDRTAEFQVQGANWIVPWMQGGMLCSALFLPMLMTLRAAGLTRLKHERRNWRRMASYGTRVRVAHAGKLMVLARFALGCQAVLLAAMLAAGVLLGLPPDAMILRFVSWALAGALAAWMIGVLHLMIGGFVPNYATNIGIGIIAALGGLALLIGMPALRPFSPHPQIELTMRSREHVSPQAGEPVVFFLSCAVFLAVGIVTGVCALRRKED